MFRLRIRIAFFFGGILAVATGTGQTDQSLLDKPLALFYEMKIDQALPLLEQIVRNDEKNAEAQTWLAETYRRLGRTEDAMRTVRKALVLSDCSSFAHLVLAQASYPDHDTIIVHLGRAIECDSTDPNAWLMMWGEAIRQADPALRNKCLGKLVETGFFTDAALAYGRAELRTLPPNAILITNGDMDTYPAQAVQVTEHFRQDVAVIEREHFGFSWSCRFIRDHQGVQLPVPDERLDLLRDSTDSSGATITTAEQMFWALLDQKARDAFTRPIAIAPTVEEGFYSRHKQHLRYHGMFLLWTKGPSATVADTSGLRRCLAGINRDDFTGPWASLKDRSPVRRCYTKDIVRVVSRIALTYSEEMIRSQRLQEAERTLDWLEQFEENTELGSASEREITRLRATVQQKAP